MFQRTRALLRRFTSSGEDRRAHPRHEVDLETTCHFLADGTDVQARIRNVSRSGLSLEVPREVSLGTMVHVQIPTSINGPRTTMLACVTNIRPVSPGGWALGCVFSLELTDEELKRLGGQKQLSPESDQRAWVRFPVRGRVECRILPEESDFEAELLDISPGGLCLVAPKSIEPGQALTVALPRGMDLPERTMLVCVVYQTARPGGAWAIGCNFLHELSEKELSEFVWPTDPS